MEGRVIPNTVPPCTMFKRRNGDTVVVKKRFNWSSKPGEVLIVTLALNEPRTLPQDAEHKEDHFTRFLAVRSSW